MGVGISAHRLAGSVAQLGAVGTVSSVDLRRHHKDLMAQTGKSRDKAMIDAANLVALDREIKAAHVIVRIDGEIFGRSLAERRRSGSSLPAGLRHRE